MPAKTREERAAYARAWRAKNPEKSRALDAKKRAKNPQAAVERMRVWRERQRIERPEEFAESVRRQNVEWRKNNHEKRLAYERQYRADNIDKLRAANSKWAREARKKDPLRLRRRSLRLLYNITLEEYESLLAAQDGVCSICKTPPTNEHHGVLHVDHCHTGGQNRGLLCHRCNTALGLFKDDPERLTAAIAYLKPPD